MLDFKGVLIVGDFFYNQELLVFIIITFCTHGVSLMCVVQKGKQGLLRF